MRCPKCGAAVTGSPDEAGLLACPQCATRLRTKTTAVFRVQGTEKPAGPAPAPIPFPSVGGSASDIDSVLARLEAPPLNPHDTLPPGTPLKKIPRPGEPGAPGSPVAALALAATQTPAGALDAILAEVRAVRRMQEEILAVLRGQPVPPSAVAAEVVASGVRVGRRKTVLLVDDDPDTRHATVDVLERAQVPVKTASDGNEALAAIAIERPDVIAVEYGITGVMAGKNFVQLINSTRELSSIPIIFYTRVGVGGAKEAHDLGARDLVRKGPKGPETLLSTVLALFRKG